MVHKMYLKNSWLVEKHAKKMDRVQKVRSVPHGQIYRPVFDAEEQLIKVSQSDLIINSINQSENALKRFFLVDKIAQESFACARVSRRRHP